MKTAVEFWAKVERHGAGCWPWTGALDSRGYGSLRWAGGQARAHRVAWMLNYGAIANATGHHGVVVMHRCDNRLCCNPAHLALGSHFDNMQDMKAKGRRKSIGSGVSNGRAKITIEQVAAIRADTRGKRVIAAEIGISPAQVQRIRLGKQWTSPAA